jgi:hypothetical protein
MTEATIERFAPAKTITQFCKIIEKTIKAIQKKKSKLTDFGEKIGGAKKDQWKIRAMNSGDLADMNDLEAVEHVKKDNVWPRPDYVKMVQDGKSPATAYLIKKIRTAIPSQITVPKNQAAIKEASHRYITLVSMLREKCESVGDINELAEMRRDQNIQDAISDVSFEYKKASKLRNALDISNYDIRKAEKETNRTGWPTDKKPWLSGKFVSNDGNGISVHNGKRYLKMGFETAEEAEAWLKSEYEKGITKRKKKDKVARPQLANIERVGKNYREGKNVNGDDVLSTFSFKGGEFGNWLSEQDRQQSLNHAYDAMMDLSDVMGVDPKDLSLGGKLSIAFGSRGRSKALAHYEPGRRVINLTKMKGAGSLAHEFAHAFDHLLGGDESIQNPYASQGKNSHLPEGIKEALEEVNEVLFKRQVSQSELKDETHLEAGNISDKIKAIFDKNPLVYKHPEVKKDPASLIQALLDIPNRDNEIDAEDWTYNLKNAWKAISKDYAAEGSEYFYDKEIQKELVPLLNEKIHIIRKLERINRSASDKITEQDSEYLASAKQMDGKKKKAYWAAPQEMFARAFESYVQDQIENNWGKSDYLVNSTKGKNIGNIAYPDGQERELTNKAFKKLLTAISENGFLREMNKELTGSADDFKITFKNDQFYLESKEARIHAKPTNDFGKKSEWRVINERGIAKGDPDKLKRVYGIEAGQPFPAEFIPMLDAAIRKERDIPEEVPREMMGTFMQVKKYSVLEQFGDRMLESSDIVEMELSELQKLSGLLNQISEKLNTIDRYEPTEDAFNEHPTLEDAYKALPVDSNFRVDYSASNVGYLYDYVADSIKSVEKLIEYKSDLNKNGLTHDQFIQLTKTSKIGESFQPIGEAVTERFKNATTIDEFCQVIQGTVNPSPVIDDLLNAEVDGFRVVALEDRYALMSKDTAAYAKRTSSGVWMFSEQENSDVSMLDQKYGFKQGERVPKKFLPILKASFNDTYRISDTLPKELQKYAVMMIDDSSFNSTAERFLETRSEQVAREYQADLKSASYTNEELFDEITKGKKKPAAVKDPQADEPLSKFPQSQKEIIENAPVRIIIGDRPANVPKDHVIMVTTRPLRGGDNGQEWRDSGKGMDGSGKWFAAINPNIKDEKYDEQFNGDDIKYNLSMDAHIALYIPETDLQSLALSSVKLTIPKYYEATLERVKSGKYRDKEFIDTILNGFKNKKTFKDAQSYYQRLIDTVASVEASIAGEVEPEPVEEDNAFSPENHVKISADTIEELRRPDVFRVMEAALDFGDDQYSQMKEFILSNRPDLEKEVDSVHTELMGKGIGESLTTRKRQAKRHIKGNITKKRKSGHRLQGRLRVYGLDIAIENKKGSKRKGIDPNGDPWETTMVWPYGYIRASLGKDADAVDCFIGPDKKALLVYVIAQHKVEKTETSKDGRDSKGRLWKDSPEAYDEDKVMLCFKSKKTAIAAYKTSYDRPELFLGPVSTYTVKDFKKVLKKSFGKKIPVKIGESLQRVQWIKDTLESGLHNGVKLSRYQMLKLEDHLKGLFIPLPS